MLCICYVYVMCMLFVCNMMSTASAPWNLQENKVPDVFWAHAPARTRAPSSALDVLSGSERTERAEPTLRGTARKTLISQRSDERNRPVTDLSQTSLAADGITMCTMRKVTLQPFWVYVGEFDHFWSWLQMTSHGVWKRLNALPHSPWPFQVCHLSYCYYCRCRKSGIMFV